MSCTLGWFEWCKMEMEELLKIHLDSAAANAKKKAHNQHLKIVSIPPIAKQPTSKRVVGCNLLYDAGHYHSNHQLNAYHTLEWKSIKVNNSFFINCTTKMYLKINSSSQSISTCPCIDICLDKQQVTHFVKHHNDADWTQSCCATIRLAQSIKTDTDTELIHGKYSTWNHGMAVQVIGLKY